MSQYQTLPQAARSLPTLHSRFGMEEVMERFCSRDSCDDCPERFICPCLQVTEEQVIEAVVRFGLRTIRDVTVHTEAGAGCTACHRRLRSVVEVYAHSSSSPPICSVK